MKIVNYSAFSFTEAAEYAKTLGVTEVKDVTRSFKNAGTTAESFAEEVLAKKAEPNVAYIVTVDKGTPNHKARPYTYTNNPTSGAAKKTRVFEVRTVDTDTLVAVCPSKSTAIKEAKAKMVDVKQDMYCRVVYTMDDAHNLSFKLDYNPSKNTHKGTYLIFTN